MRRLLPLLFLLATPALAQVGGVHQLTRVGDKTWVAEPRFGGANATIIAEDGYTVLVDPHSDPGTAGALAEEAEALTGTPIRYVINTHWHGGNRSLDERYPSQITFIAHPNTRRDILEHATPELRRMGGFYATFADNADAALQTGAFADGTLITDPQREQIARFVTTLRAFVADSGTYEYLLPEPTVDDRIMVGTLEVFHPGRFAHTEGDLVVRMTGIDVLIVGDLLSAPYVVPRSGYPRAYAETLRGLAASAPRGYILGHGGPLKRGQDFALTMADFMTAIADWVEQGPERDPAQAALHPTIAPYESRIDWNEPGLRFLDFPQLVALTATRAQVELQSSRTEHGRN